MKNTVLVFVFLLLSFYGYSQSCVSSVAISSAGTAICPGSSLVLTATPTGGAAPYKYAWSNGDTTASITVDKPGTYTVTVSKSGCPSVPPKSIVISSASTPAAPTAASVSVCRNSSATLTATAPGGTYQWYDAPSGGNFLFTGPTYTTPPLTTTTTYYVETTLSGCTSPRTAVTANIIGNPAVVGDTVCAGTQATLSASGADSYIWYDAPTGGNVVSTTSTFITPPLNQTTTYYLVATTSGCTSPRLPVVATVNPPPQPPVASSVTICSGSSATLQATASAGVFNWYNVPSGGTSLISSPDYTTPPLTATTTYYVEITLNECMSTRTPVTVTVDANPLPPVNQIDTICPNTNITLIASTSPSGTYEWYDALIGGTLLSTGVNYTTPVLNSSTNYYVQNINGPCSSGRATVQVIVKQAPAAPSVSQPLICPGSSAILTATAPGGNYEWYTAATGGTLLTAGPSFTTPDLTTNTTYYVQTTIDGCTSARTSVTVSIIPPTAGPTAAGDTICPGQYATLTATGGTGDYTWYDSATGGNYLSSGRVYITPTLTTTTTYYVQTTTTNGCPTLRTPVTVTVNPAPPKPTVTAKTVCPGTRDTLVANAGPGVMIVWYGQPTGGTALATGNTFITPPLPATTVYYAESITNACGSTRVAVTASVINVANPQFQYPTSTVCASSTNNPTPTINNPSGGTFSASPGGLVFVSKSTGQINVAASTPGNYVINFDGKGTCVTTTAANFTITTSFDATFSYSGGPYCQSQTNPSPVFPAGASGGTFTASPSGLVFLNKSSGEINLALSKPGTYTITNTIATSATCSQSIAKTTITIDEAVVISAGPNQTVQSGTPVQLAGSVSGATATWSGGNGTFSNPNLPNAVYTPGAGETSVRLTFTSAKPAGPCSAESAEVTITFVNAPAAPTALGEEVCSGNSAVLSATAPGGTYEWFSAATGGTLLFRGPNFITPPITANTTYYVQTTIGGITSPRTAVTVTVSAALPGPSVAAIAPICMGTTATLTASGSAGNYGWYDSPTGGNLLSTSSTYTTPPLSANATYFVQVTNNGCTSTRTQANVSVIPLPVVTSPDFSNICSGNAQDYNITANVATASFSWSRPQVTNISNPSVTNQTSSVINETLINTGITPVNVIYVITPTANGCSGPSFNYEVTVNPLPVVTSPATYTVCSGTSANYAVNFNIPATGYSWSREANPGISNTPVSGQTGEIQEVLVNTTNLPVNVTYVFVYGANGCSGTAFNLVVTVNPAATITSAATAKGCSGVPQDYPIISNVQSATFIWSRASVTNISNPAVSNQTTDTITEALVNTGTIPVRVKYLITPMANGCEGTPFTYTVTVSPIPASTVASSNTPVCLGSTINLFTPKVAGATYMWTGPNGYTSNLQNPIISNATTASTGTYNVYVIINSCTSPPASVAVVVDEPPIANAGPPDQNVCIDVTSVTLAGSVTGGTTTGIWTTSGTGTFSPSSAQLNAQYIFSAQDKAKGSVTLTLASTSNDDCNISTATTIITFKEVPGANAGPDQYVCSQNTSVQLNGKILTTGGGVWSTSGTGTFSPSANASNATYTPSAADIKMDSVTLTLLATSATSCFYPTDSMVVHFLPPPVVNAGGTRYVLVGNTITLNPTVNETAGLHYLWSPNTDINNDTLKNPVITGNTDITYTLTVTDSLGCVSTSQTMVIVSPELKIPNTFTPNGDGRNDVWDIQGLIAYGNATVDIFNRYGTKIFHSAGYGVPWDGTYNGKPVPVGTYYYIIDTKVNNQVLSGYVAVIR